MDPASTSGRATAQGAEGAVGEGGRAEWETDWKHVSIEADELAARLFQHEFDHLEGILLLERLDDDTRKDALQVRVGQGEVEYGKLIGQLRRVSFGRSLEVNIQPMDGVDQSSEMRKIRLLLESLM